MRFSDETLMAYADGELDAETRAAVDAAMANDPDFADAIALQIENGHALKSKLHAAFDAALHEEVPARLVSAAQKVIVPAPEPVFVPVAHLPTAPAAAVARTTAHWSWPQWAAIAASLVVGVLVGRISFDRSEDPFLLERGHMTARAALDGALSSQAGGAVDRATGIQIGVSYLTKSGEYCRTFIVRDTQTLGGLACRRNQRWTIDALTPTKAAASGAYRMAGAAVPALILGIVEDTIAGDPLDAEQEAEARAKNWQR
jgi:hypothetical protein